MARYAHLLFDADNTLFDFDASSHKAFEDLLRYYGIVPTQEIYGEYKKLNATVWAELEQGAIEMATVKTKRWQLFWDLLGRKYDYLESNTLYLKYLVEHCFLLDETLQLLQYFQSYGGIQMHIITNGMKEAQRPRIERLGIAPFFKTITVSDEIGFAKPDKDFFDHVFKGIKDADRKTALVIGDGLQSDIKGGIEYGLDTCWFNPSKKLNVSDFKPTYEISTLLEVKEIV